MKADGKMRKTVFNRAVWPSHTTPARKATMHSVQSTKSNLQCPKEEMRAGMV
ncbi:hypothetical protein I79_013105 [Cricetulus griseus]|uniref:Uncharacterized protein n=1 Tax=Cricetulus griseus TaxID=10029 RepID=G3HQK1_CRIGR|nr:hypothetical protein I79_013105 [Cricetulus griseus]